MEGDHTFTINSRCDMEGFHQAGSLISIVSAMCIILGMTLMSHIPVMQYDSFVSPVIHLNRSTILLHFLIMYFAL